MTVDQDLSGDMVKVVQFSIVSIATNEIDNAKLLFGPETVVFGDDMTAADFTAWILSKYRVPVIQNAAYIRDCLNSGREIDLGQWRVHRATAEHLAPLKEALKKAAGATGSGSELAKLIPSIPVVAKLSSKDPLADPKWHRVAFHVISRFAPVDIDWSQAQARALGQLAYQLKPPVAVDIQMAAQKANVTIDEKNHFVEVNPLLGQPDESSGS